MLRRLAWCVPLFAYTASAEVTLPQGWRTPAAAQNDACVQPGDDPYRVTADFDGDGITDEARLLFKPRTRTLGLWIWLASSAPQLLFHWSDIEDGKHTIGMGLMPGPGSSPTVCGRTGQCGPGDPKWISWSRPGIDLYACEASNQLVWWDAQRKRFRSAFMTD